MLLLILKLLLIVFNFLLIKIVGFKLLVSVIWDNMDVYVVFLWVLEMVILYLWFFIIWFKNLVLFINVILFFLVYKSLGLLEGIVVVYIIKFIFLILFLLWFM